MSIYIYMSFLLLLIFLSYEVITSTIKYCPIKIREAILLPFVLVCLRVGSLMLLLLADDMKFVYLVKNFLFLNIIYVPMLIFLSIYVFYRNTKINLNWIYSIFFIGTISYLFCIFTYPTEYYISLSYGYNVVLLSDMPYKLLLCINAVAFFIGVNSIKYKHSIKWGSIVVLMVSLIFIVSIVMSLRSSEHIGYLLIGDLSLLLSLYSSIMTFRIKAKGHNVVKYRP